MVLIDLSRKAIMLIAASLLVGLVICISILVPHLQQSPSTPTISVVQKEVLSNFFVPRWTRYTSSFSIENAFVADIDANHQPIYICRAVYSSYVFDEDIDLIPGLFDPKKGVCIISYGYSAYEYKEFQVLTTEDQSSLIWVETSHGIAPEGVVIGGQTTKEDELPIAKFEKEGQILIGSVHDRYGLAFAAFEGTETESSYYHVLCMEEITI
ncbi:uncharacterized protein LOC128396489 [Panonychus citri]|uniref:uncharacterized protein LOC128396489 n=1 Tax=Panonychus citri TaxID=50023 RepID=UPI0023070F4E|nr:uncharacterized protein LOC128396489 [Panonychus citri]